MVCVVRHRFDRALAHETEYRATAFSSQDTPLPEASSTTAIPSLICRGWLRTGFHQSAYSSQ